MSWPPAIVVNPPESVLAGIVLWKRRGTALVTVIVKQLFGVSADGVAQAVGPRPSDALTGDDRVPFKPRADVIVALPEAPQTMLEIWRGTTSILKKNLAAEKCVRRSSPSGRGPAATVIELPADLDPRLYQIAPEDQQLDSLVPGDCLIIHGGAKARMLVPKLEVTIHLRSPRGGWTPLALNIDAIEWDLPKARCAVIARGQVPWDDAVDAIVVAVTSPPLGTMLLDPEAAAKARAGLVSPFQPQGNPTPPPSLPVRSPNDCGSTATLDAASAARARAAALTPFKASSAEPSRPVQPASVSEELTSTGVGLSTLQRGPAMPFVAPAAPSTSRAALAAVPTGPRVESGTLAPEDMQRMARELAAPAAPVAPRIDTGTIAADASEEIQRLARSLAAGQQQGAPLPIPPPPPPFPYAPPPAPYLSGPPAYTPPPVQPHPAPALQAHHAPPRSAPAPGGLVAQFLDAEPEVLSSLDDDELPSP